ncbi:MAG: ATP-binding protein [Bacillota bacterium]|nr:ATP-binding protein [Bacillota bacterium]
MAFYAPALRERFTDRKQPLAHLHYWKEQTWQGCPSNLALFGLRRIGKTLLLKEFVAQTQEPDVIPVYINLEDMCGSPELFTLKFIGNIAFWVLTRGEGDISHFLNRAELLTETLTGDRQSLRDAVLRLNAELEKAEIDRHFLLDLAFALPEAVAREAGVNLLLLLDEFQSIMTLANYPQTQHVIAVLRKHIEQQERCSWLVAGSAITTLEKLVVRHESPLFMQFSRITLAPFGFEDTWELGRKILPDLDRPMAEELYLLTFGHPFYITRVCEQAHRLRHLQEFPPSQELIRQAFLLETLRPEGSIYSFCRYLYDLSLHQARGYGSLITVLEILAQEEGLTLSQIARKQHTSAASSRNYLHWLQEVDLVLEQDRRYYFRDPVLRYWLSQVSLGVEVTEFTPVQTWQRLLEGLGEKFQRTASELGLAKESQIRELMASFADQVVDGGIFGRTGRMRLPRFTVIRPYQEKTAAGQTEIDVLAENGEKWAVEVKCGTREASVADLKRFHDKAKGMADKLWFISRLGFKDSALNYAQAHGIMISDRTAVQALAETVGVRFSK